MTDNPKDQAIHWMLRQRAGDMDEAEWDAFTLWLEASPEHPRLLDEVQAADDALEAARSELAQPQIAANENLPEAEVEPLPQPANDNQLRRALPFLGLVAAALAVFAIWPTAAPTPVLYTTEPGEMQTVALGDDITLTINGGSEVAVIEEETRVTIARGEVAFDIDSAEPSPLRVEVGDLVLTDYGTVFNVILSEAFVNVAVAEGVVGINPDTSSVEVKAGEQVTQSLSGGALIRSEVDVETVGTWAQGRLEFDNTPAPEAAAMLERTIGAKVSLASGLRNETLTGSLIVSDNEREMVTQFAAILGAQARQGRVSDVRAAGQDGASSVWNIR